MLKGERENKILKYPTTSHVTEVAQTPAHPSIDSIIIVHAQWQRSEKEIT